MTNKLFEAYGDETSAKDGGFVFQAVISHDINWEIVDGEIVFDPKSITAMLHQVDVFPDLKFNSGSATLTYVILSEVNILKRKFELASEAIMKRIKPEYAQESQPNIKESFLSSQKRELLVKHFSNTRYKVRFTTDHIVLREVSTSGIDTGSPQITMKVSTGMVDTLDGTPIQTWDKFKVEVSGSGSLTLSNDPKDPISSIEEYDVVENLNDLIFRTIVPSLILQFSGDKVAIDTYSNRSSMVSLGVAKIDYDNIFKVEDPSQDKKEKEDSLNK